MFDVEKMTDMDSKQATTRTTALVCQQVHQEVQTDSLPGTDGGTRLRSAVTVASAACSGVYLVGHDWPAVTMLGFSSVPSRKI